MGTPYEYLWWNRQCRQKLVTLKTRMYAPVSTNLVWQCFLERIIALPLENGPRRTLDICRGNLAKATQWKVLKSSQQTWIEAFPGIAQNWFCIPMWPEDRGQRWGQKQGQTTHCRNPSSANWSIHQDGQTDNQISIILADGPRPSHHHQVAIVCGSLSIPSRNIYVVSTQSYLSDAILDCAWATREPSGSRENHWLQSLRTTWDHSCPFS